MLRIFYTYTLFALIILYLSFIQRVYADNAATPDVNTLNFPEIIINEVSFKNPSHDWVELYVINDKNNGNGNSLRGLRFHDDSDFYTINEEINIFTGDYIILSFKEETNEIIEYGNVKKIHITKSGLTGTTEQIAIKNNNGQFIDAVCWVSDSPTQSEIQDFNSIKNENQWNANDIFDCINSNEISGSWSAGRSDFRDTNTKTDFLIYKNPTPGNENKITNNAPTAVIEIQSGETKAEGKVTINVNGSASVDPEGEEITFLWDFGDGFTYEKANPPMHSYIKTGQYTLKLTVTDPLGESDTDEMKIEVTEKEIDIPGDITDSAGISEKKINTMPAAGTIEDATAPASSCLDSVIINEIFPNPEGKDDDSEWIELYNRSEKLCSLEGFKIDDEDGGSKPYLINQKIPGLGFLLLPSWQTGITLNNTEDSVRLFSADGNLIEEIKYKSTYEQKSYSRFNDNIFEWTNVTTPLLTNKSSVAFDENLSENSEKNSTKKSAEKNVSRNGSLSDEIVISEILPNPSGTDKGKEWLEIHNKSAKEVNLGNWSLDNGPGSKTAFIFDEIILAPDEYLLLTDSELGFSLKNTNGELRLLNYEEKIMDSVEYGSSPEENSFMKTEIIEGSAVDYEFRWTSFPTPGEKNLQLYVFHGKILNLEKETGNLIISDSSNNQNTINLKVILDGDTLITQIFKPGTLIKAFTKKINEAEFELTEYEIIEEASEDLNTNSEGYNLIYYILSSVPPLGFLGYMGFKKYFW